MVGEIVYMDTRNLYDGLSWADWILYLIIIYAIYYFSKMILKKAFTSYSGGDEE